jgi:Mlc titration factor MtfA (ptsG expression regulator)
MVSLALIVLMIILGVGSIFYDIGEFIYYKLVDAAAIVKPLSANRKAILEKYFFYYNKLSRSDQKKFEERVSRFLHSKRFIGRGITITEEMKILTAATAVLISFGLPMVTLTHFDKILIYADTYYSHINRQYHLGEVNPRLGIIILSWKSFVEGFVDNKDARNLALHEMAHALHFENQIRNEEYDFLNRNALAHWDQLAAQEINQVRDNTDHLLRQYAGTNEHEFFAVAMETFFENSHQFNKALPELYHTMCLLLKQNPMLLYKL